MLKNYNKQVDAWKNSDVSSLYSKHTLFPKVAKDKNKGKILEKDEISIQQEIYSTNLPR